jgi:quercetin dioxygenase-like cupin family protein
LYVRTKQLSHEVPSGDGEDTVRGDDPNELQGHHPGSLRDTQRDREREERSVDIIDIDGLKPPSSNTARFVGAEHGASASFFVVGSPPGEGADEHRHPYEEVFVNLGGRVEVTVDGETRMLEGGTIAVVPAGAWHGFKNRSEEAALMVNIHPAPTMVQEYRHPDGPPSTGGR